MMLRVLLWIVLGLGLPSSMWAQYGGVEPPPVEVQPGFEFRSLPPRQRLG